MRKTQLVILGCFLGASSLISTGISGQGRTDKPAQAAVPVKVPATILYPPELFSRAERTQYRKTTTYQDILDFVAALALNT
jgi:hypothetical protein